MLFACGILVLCCHPKSHHVYCPWLVASSCSLHMFNLAAALARDSAYLSSICYCLTWPCIALHAWLLFLLFSSSFQLTICPGPTNRLTLCFLFYMLFPHFTCFLFQLLGSSLKSNLQPTLSLYRLFAYFILLVCCSIIYNSSFPVKALFLSALTVLPLHPTPPVAGHKSRRYWFWPVPWRTRVRFPTGLCIFLLYKFQYSVVVVVVFRATLIPDLAYVANDRAHLFDTFSFASCQTIWWWWGWWFLYLLFPRIFLALSTRCVDPSIAPCLSSLLLLWKILPPVFYFDFHACPFLAPNIKK